jgi:hypothetical protein
MANIFSAPVFPFTVVARISRPLKKSTYTHLLPIRLSNFMAFLHSEFNKNEMVPCDGISAVEEPRTASESARCADEAHRRMKPKPGAATASEKTFISRRRFSLAVDQERH